jgi:retron-type reverse transcriptase
MSLIDELSIEFEIGRRDLEKFIRTAPARYKVFQIKKRHGGMRTIAQPSAALKSIQRYILRNKLIYLPVHPAASAYVVGKSITDNAAHHSSNRFILKLDFENFFPSIIVTDWRRIVRRAKPEQIESVDLPLYEKLLFWGAGSIKPSCLSIGAPSSPFLSNAALFDLDTKLQMEADKRKLIYTRYADDMTISGDSVSTILKLEQHAIGLINKSVSPRLKFNEQKRGLYGRGSRRMVTGLIITPDSTISIGRERKRLISAMLHRALEGTIDVLELGKLKGLLGFCISSEPSFLDRMREKYGSEVIDRVLQMPITRR